MASASERFSEFPRAEASAIPTKRGWTIWAHIGLAYGLILAAVWTPDGAFKITLMTLAATVIFFLTEVSPYSARDLGLAVPPALGTIAILVFGAGMALFLPVAADLLHENGLPARPLPWHGVWQYVTWAVLQQFILQSFFYLRLEKLLGSRLAVFLSAGLFAAAHIPSPVLTAATFVGGVFFCEMCRRYRSIYPLGLVHAGLGMMIAASFPDALLHHMRVGIGYLLFHS